MRTCFDRVHLQKKNSIQKLESCMRKRGEQTHHCAMPLEGRGVTQLNVLGVPCIWLGCNGVLRCVFVCIRWRALARLKSRDERRLATARDGARCSAPPVAGSARYRGVRGREGEFQESASCHIARWALHAAPFVGLGKNCLPLALSWALERQNPGWDASERSACLCIEGWLSCS